MRVIVLDGVYVSPGGRVYQGIGVIVDGPDSWGSWFPCESVDRARALAWCMQSALAQSWACPGVELMECVSALGHAGVC